MRKPFWLGWTAALLSCTGCFTPPPEPLVAPPAVPAPMARAPVRPLRPPVTAEQVTRDNAQQKAQELLEEMDFEQQQTMLNPPR